MSELPDTVVVQPPWAGVSVDAVRALVPTLSISPVDATPAAPAVGNDPWGEGPAERRITEEMVEGYISQVASRVTSRLSRWSAIPETSPFAESVRVSAYDSVVNGAASYAFAAAAPEKAGLSETTSYSEVLWQRHLDSLNVARQALDEWVEGGGSDDPFPAPRRGAVMVSSRPASFSDCMRW